MKSYAQYLQSQRPLESLPLQLVDTAGLAATILHTQGGMSMPTFQMDAISASQHSLWVQVLTRNMTKELRIQRRLILSRNQMELLHLNLMTHILPAIVLL